MKSLQNNTLKTNWPRVAILPKNDYFCSKFTKKMSDETQLTERNDKGMTLRPYTKEEIDAMIEESERDFEAGRVYTTEEVIDYCKKELAKLKKP
jgi:hypothetical protein